MKIRKLPHFIIIIGLLALSTLFLLTTAWGTPVQDVISGVFVFVFYGLLIIGYLMRFVFIFLGVFGVYRIFQEHFNRQMAV
jgi:hypothetical protein